MKFPGQKLFLLFLCCLTGYTGLGQFNFSGQLNNANTETQVYLSLVEDYRKINRAYLDQIILKTAVDSVGNFSFTGNNLHPVNRIYRIHIDACGEMNPTDHFLGSCNDIKSVLFIANNMDKLHLPSTFENEVFCEINSTNPKSVLLLEIDAMKEQMQLDFAQYDSETSRQLNLETWFIRFQEYGEKQAEPLAELYIYEFLSDKRSITYDHYLREINTNPYYSDLLSRLELSYPSADFTSLYKAEITTDKDLAQLRNPDSARSDYILYSFLALSVLLNGFLLIRWMNSRKQKALAIRKLTRQELKIVENILEDKSNKEIADALFVSVSTVKSHINNLYKKLEVTDREAIKSLFKNKITPGTSP